MKQAVSKLPVKYREVIIHRHYGGLSIEETAEALRISVGTAKSRWFRGIKKLQAWLKDCKDLTGLLYEFVTKRLDKERSWLVKEHLTICKRCRADLEELKKTLKALKGIRSRRRAMGAVNKLPGELRDAIILVHDKGLSYETVAEQLEMPVEKVKARFLKGINVLKESL